MKRPLISFRHYAGSGPLSIYWHDGSYGNAVEAKAGHGVGWFAANGDLLGIELDDVAYQRDQQALSFSSGDTVEIRVAHGTVSVRTAPHRRPAKVA